MAESGIDRSFVRDAVAAIEDFRARIGRSRAIDEIFDEMVGVLRRLDDALGGGGELGHFRGSIRRAVDRFESAMGEFAPEVQTFAGEAIVRARLLERQLGGGQVEIPSRPLFGALPIARIIPQGVHSVMDYSNGLTAIVPAFFAESAGARFASVVLGASILSVSATTDYRLSAVKLIPIEVHEALDYVWGATAIAAPFVFGYIRRDPVIAAMHILSGIATIAGSLITDYRAVLGRGRSAIAAAAMEGAEIQPGLSAHVDYARG